MRTMKRLLLLSLLLPFTVQAQFTFTSNNGAITITSYTGPGGDVVIPDATNGYPVKNIGNNAFQFNKTSLTNVTIPNSITNIGNGVFNGCTNLTNDIIGNGVGKLGGQVFCNCYQLTNVIVSSNVVDLGVQTFRSCSNLTGVFFEGNPPAVD